MILGPAVDAPADSSAALWIAPTLGEFGTVGGLVPRGYERYLLVDHRSEEHRGSEGVCRLYDQLIPVVARHTSTPDRCWFAIWEGHGFDTSMAVLAATPRDDDERREVERERQRLREDDARRNAAIRADLTTLASFDLPHRRYYLVRGALTAASRIERPDGPFPQPPDLWWPDDRRWFVGGDTDLDWCYIAGSVRLCPPCAPTSGVTHAPLIGRRRTPLSANREHRHHGSTTTRGVRNARPWRRSKATGSAGMPALS